MGAPYLGRPRGGGGGGARGAARRRCAARCSPAECGAALYSRRRRGRRRRPAQIPWPQRGPGWMESGLSRAFGRFCPARRLGESGCMEAAARRAARALSSAPCGLPPAPQTLRARCAGETQLHREALRALPPLGLPGVKPANATAAKLEVLPPPPRWTLAELLPPPPLTHRVTHTHTLLTHSWAAASASAGLRLRIPQGANPAPICYIRLFVGRHQAVQAKGRFGAGQSGASACG